MTAPQREAVLHHDGPLLILAGPAPFLPFSPLPFLCTNNTARSAPFGIAITRPLFLNSRISTAVPSIEDIENAYLANANPTRPRPAFRCARRSFNSQLAELRRMGFEIQSLIPQERTGVEGPRYTLRRGEATFALDDLRGLLAAVRSSGEKALKVTRFKGLGSMDAEELRDTTMWARPGRSD